MLEYVRNIQHDSALIFEMINGEGVELLKGSFFNVPRFLYSFLESCIKNR